MPIRIWVFNARVSTSNAQLSIPNTQSSKPHSCCKMASRILNRALKKPHFGIFSGTDPNSPVPPIVVVERSQSAQGALGHNSSGGGNSSTSGNGLLLSPGPVPDGSALPSGGGGGAGGQSQPSTTVATTSLYVPQVAYAPDVKSWWSDQSNHFGQKHDYFPFDEDIKL